MNSKNEKLVPSEGMGDVAVIGEGTPNQLPVSLQIVQSVYHELTGKTEEVSKSYTEHFKVCGSDFEQLNLRIQQAYEQYNIKAETHEFQIFYQNDTKDRFTSFEKFRAFNSGSSSAVESVVFKYNFLVLLPKTNQPQSYTVTVRVASPVAIEQKMRNQLFEMPKILKIMGTRTAVVNVEYVDYMVARNLLEVVDCWFKTLSTTQPSQIFSFIQKRSRYLPLICRYLVGIFVAYLVFQAIPIALKTDSTPPQLALFLIAAFIGLFSSYKLAGHLGSAAEDAIDRWSPVGYVELTAGDKKQIEEAESLNKINIASAIAHLVGSFVVAVLARVVANWLIT